MGSCGRACSLAARLAAPLLPHPVRALSPASPVGEPTPRGEGAGKEGLLPGVTSAVGSSPPRPALTQEKDPISS